MKLCNIASSSSGNCTLVCSDTTKILVDLGITKKRLETEMEEIGEDPALLNGILVTHEHSDHIRGLGVFARKYGVPIYATGKTIDCIRQVKGLGEINEDLFCSVEKDCSFRVGDIMVQPVGISHDAADPVAYKMQCEGKQAGILTDLGTYDEYIVDSFRGLDAILLEANHDVRMLQVGSYPYYLKQRILSAVGHLSNDASAQLLGELLHDNLKYAMLGHISQENNMEEIAYETVRQEMEHTAEEKGCPRPEIKVAHRNRRSDMIEI